MKFAAIFFGLSLVVLAGCSGTEKKPTPDEDVNMKHPSEKAVSDVAADSVMEKNGIIVYRSKMGQMFDHSTLKLLSPLKSNLPKGDTLLKFQLDSFELGAMTDDLKRASIDNSSRGQSIHLIVNGEPYMALFDSSARIRLEPGENYVLGFLARSYHEGVKHDSASFLQHYFVGKAKSDSATADTLTPMLFYNSPSGSYSGGNTKKILLDFYLKNVTLSPTGYKVRATINNEPFVLTQWAPYYIEGLTLGKNRIKLELIDSLNNPVPAAGTHIPGKYQNTGERVITLKQGPATPNK